MAGVELVSIESRGCAGFHTIQLQERYQGAPFLNGRADVYRRLDPTAPKPPANLAPSKIGFIIIAFDERTALHTKDEAVVFLFGSLSFACWAYGQVPDLHASRLNIGSISDDFKDQLFAARRQFQADTLWAHFPGQNGPLQQHAGLGFN